MSRGSRSASLSTVHAVLKGLQERLRTVRRYSCEQLGSTRAVTLKEFSGPVLRCTEASSKGGIANYDVRHPGKTAVG